MRLLSETKALARLDTVISKFKSEISSYETRAKSCATCETKGACCLDEHFVNVRISRLEAVAINRAIDAMESRNAVIDRIGAAIDKFKLSENDERTYACPLFDKSLGCVVHETGKPLPCIAHACYERKAHLPPDRMLTEREIQVDRLNTQTYGHAYPLLPIPVALERFRKL